MSNSSASGFNPLDIDLIVKQTVDNHTAFIISITFCVIAFIAQIINVVLVFRHRVSRSRGIFFYMVFTSAVLGSLIYVMNGARLIVVYLSGHTQLWFLVLVGMDLSKDHELFTLRTDYVFLVRATITLYSMFTILYITCVQLRFQSIRVLFKYPKWVDYSSIALTVLVWMSTDLLWNVILFDTPKYLMMTTIWTCYVVLVDNVVSGIFLWRLWKAMKEIGSFTKKRGNISRTIIRSMIGTCVTLWVSIIVSVVALSKLSDLDNQNAYALTTVLGFDAVPIFFAFGLVWMQAVVQLYSSGKPSQSGSSNGNTQTSGSANVVPPPKSTLSIQMNITVAQTSGPARQLWDTIEDDESGESGERPVVYDDGSNPMLEMKYVTYPQPSAGQS